MTPFDKKYLSLQFSVRVHEKSGSEYQSFFESIMEKAFPDFQKVRPYGNEGDKGNDGYRPACGIYYQVYAPLDPHEKEADAAAKFKADFAKLKAGWDKIAEVREVNFVYNDKSTGLTIKLEEARAELRDGNPSITFRIFTPRQLEEVFLSLRPEEIAALGFDLDARNALQSARDQLATLDLELDKENGDFVLRVLNAIREIVGRAEDENLQLEFDLLEARAHLKIEDVKKGRGLFEGIAKRYPADPRALLYLAEIAINSEDFDKNADFLEEAERVSPDSWLLRLQKLVRDIRLERVPDPAAIDESNFPTEPRIRANFYRLAAALIGYHGDGAKAAMFLERAVHLNPERFTTHDAKIDAAITEVMSETNVSERRRLADDILEDIATVEKRFTVAGSLGPRSQALLNLRKLHLYMTKEDYGRVEAIARDTLPLVLACHLDFLIERIAAEVTHNVELGPDDLADLLLYVRRSEKSISDVLAKAIVLQFLHKRTLLSDGVAFFREIGKESVVSFIDAVRSDEHPTVLSFIGQDVRFAVDLALALDGPELRRRIVESLPDDGSVQKDKLLLLLYYDQGELDKAYSLVQKLDLSSLSHIECLTILRVARDKKAWDAVVQLVEKMLTHEQDSRMRLQMKLQLFTANLHLERFNEVIRIGKDTLSDPGIDLLDDSDKEMLVTHTAYAYLKRRDAGAIDFVEANEHLMKTFEAKIGVQAETFVKHGDGVNALRSVVDGVKLLNHPAPEQYGLLFMIVTEIGNLLPQFDLTHSATVEPGSFVKLQEQERWYYVGDAAALDATKIVASDDKYTALLGKRVGDSVSFATKYRPENPELVIEAIYPIDKYILWQSLHHARELTEQGRWDAMDIIPIPMTEDSVDLTHLRARLEDDTSKHAGFFEIYCKQNIPLALLAVNEGGLGNAIGRIANEKKGFINALAGGAEEFEEQRRVAERMLAGEPFYLDGTSALFLTETGVLSKIRARVSGLKVPQSVIAMLLEMRQRFEASPGRFGHVAYVNGQVQFTEVDPEQYKSICEKFTKAIEVFESDPLKVSVISAANKSDSFLEQNVPPSLADACILAQREGVAILTEDFLYLKANEHETRKTAPTYASTLSLMKILCEKGHVSFTEYLDYFAYLASYRVRFLPITTDDLEVAVYGGGDARVIKPEELRKFYFALTLSEDYGVSPRAAFQVIGMFLFRTLLDDSMSSEMATRIFAEMISTVPTKMTPKELGKLLLGGTVTALNEQRKKSLLPAARIQEKLDDIAAFLQAYPPDEIITP